MDENENIVSILESTATTTLSNTDTNISTTTAGRTITTTMVPPNLLINPGAESGSLLGWNQTGSSPAIVDSNGQFNENYYPHTGNFCFAGGNGPDSPSRLTQNVKLLGGVQGFTASQLDAGSLRAELSFYYQTWYNILLPYDLVQVSLTFRSSASILSTADSGETTCTTSNPGWCRLINTFPLPRNVRSIDYTMTFIRNDVVGSNIDCYVDDNSLRII
ncbi:unnamed protein product [Rotaria sp. Silwood1]|nr:unnamed protein product [Rotaria sp. Silwood1]